MIQLLSFSFHKLLHPVFWNQMGQWVNSYSLPRHTFDGLHFIQKYSYPTHTEEDGISIHRKEKTIAEEISPNTNKMKKLSFCKLENSHFLRAGINTHQKLIVYYIPNSYHTFEGKKFSWQFKEFKNINPNYYLEKKKKKQESLN